MEAVYGLLIHLQESGIIRLLLTGGCQGLPPVFASAT